MNIRLAYTEKGSGEPLILLHGNGEDSSYFLHQIGYFSGHYRVIALDTRGHGKSPRGSKPFTIRQFAEDLRDFMDQMGMEKAHLLGFSDGGNIALTFALKHPERVSSLILNGANLDPNGMKPLVKLSVFWDYYTTIPKVRRDQKARTKVDLYGLMVHEPNFKPEELSVIDCPTLVIAGTRDMIRDSHTRLIHRSIPGSQLVILPGDHFIANREPQAFNRTVAEFLRGIN